MVEEQLIGSISLSVSTSTRLSQAQWGRLKRWRAAITKLSTYPAYCLADAGPSYRFKRFAMIPSPSLSMQVTHKDRRRVRWNEGMYSCRYRDTSLFVRLFTTRNKREGNARE